MNDEQPNNSPERPDKKWRDTTLALAGVFQAAVLVEKLGKTGQVEQPELQTSVESLFQMNPTHADEVYGGVENLELGLTALLDVLHHQKRQKYRDALRYVLGMLHLQKKLSNNSNMLNLVADRLDKASHQVQHFGSTHENVVGNLADIYRDTLSTFQFRIQVSGDYNFLQQARIANQIRTLLFAGIRSSILWRQLGGKRWHIILFRKRITKAAKALLKEINSAH